MPADLCRRCQTQPAVINLSDGTFSGTRLCSACFRAVLRELPYRLPFDLERFFMLLARPEMVGSTVSLPHASREVRCAECGLRYTEFAAQGLAGCAGCYQAFLPAIKTALSALNSIGE
jgi:protein-arginine kinase activator protein McsA